MKFHCAILALVFIALVNSHTNVHAQQPLTVSPQGYDTNPFDLSATRLPPNYSGVNADALYESLVARNKRAQKDEFETTEQFRRRVEREARSPLLGSITIESLMAMKADSIKAAYDADKELMHVEVSPADFRKLSFSSIGERVFIADLRMDIPNARRTKPNLSALAIFKLKPPYTTERYRYRGLVAELVEMWLYDAATGQVLVKKKAEEAQVPAPSPLLDKARELYNAGRDEEALVELRRALMIEPTDAEPYLLIGRIQLRRGDEEQAISALKTAIFWNSKLIDAHILLGRIFLERKDRAMAMTYVRNAIRIDPNNQEALALQRRVESTGK